MPKASFRSMGGGGPLRTQKGSKAEEAQVAKIRANDPMAKRRVKLPASLQSGPTKSVEPKSLKTPKSQ